MKKLTLLFLLIAAGGLLFTACSDDDPKPMDPSIKLSTSELEFKADETQVGKKVGVTLINLNTYDNPKCEADWVIIGDKEASSFEVFVKEYTKEEAEKSENPNKERTATITVSATGATAQTVTVTQKAPGDDPDPEYTIETSAEEIRFNADGSLFGDEVTVTTAAPEVTVNIEGSFITSAKVEDGKLVVEVTENDTEDVRTGKLTLSGEFVKQDVTVDVVQAMPELYGLEKAGNWDASNLWKYNSSTNAFGVIFGSGGRTVSVTWNGFEKFYVIENTTSDEKFIYRLDVDTSVEVDMESDEVVGRFYFEKGKALGVTRNGKEVYNGGIVWDNAEGEKKFIEIPDGERFDLVFVPSQLPRRVIINLFSREFEYKGEKSRYYGCPYGVYEDGESVHDEIIGNFSLNFQPDEDN